MDESAESLPIWCWWSVRGFLLLLEMGEISEPTDEEDDESCSSVASDTVRFFPVSWPCVLLGLIAAGASAGAVIVVVIGGVKLRAAAAVTAGIFVSGC